MIRRLGPEGLPQVFQQRVDHQLRENALVASSSLGPSGRFPLNTWGSKQPRYGCSYKHGFLFVGVLVIIALPFGVYIRALDRNSEIYLHTSGLYGPKKRT